MTISMTMTEDQIERAVEKMIDGLDRRFMSGPMTQSQYDSKMNEIRKWADYQYRGNACGSFWSKG